MSKVVNVLPVPKANIPDESEYTVKSTDDCAYPIYIEKKIEYLWITSKIDVAGWAAFRRLVLLEA